MKKGQAILLDIVRKEPGVEKILKKLTSAGFEVVIVGGAVRQILLGQKITDWDLATNAKPEQIQKMFAKSFYNNRFGTVGVPIGDKSSMVNSESNIVQITTYRAEEKYTDKRHPDKIIWGKSLEEDLKRRDFTINAIALPYAQGKLLELVDPFDGQNDLADKVIRAVGEPDKRFTEDALRLLRAVRFATVLGFDIEQKTKSAITKNANLLSAISGERIRDELFKIIESDNGAEGILMLKDLGLLKLILPELEICFAVEQKSPKRHHIFDVGTHCVLSLKYCPSGDTTVRFATLLHDIGKAKVAKVTEEGVRTFYNHEVVGGFAVLKIAKRLHLKKEDKDKLYKLVRFHQFTID